MHDIQQILDFWFSPDIAKHWFASTPALDAEIKTRFEGIWQRATAGELDAWAQTSAGALALIIVLDQLPLNMYRGLPAAFSSEQQAVDDKRWRSGNLEASCGLLVGLYGCSEALGCHVCVEAHRVEAELRGKAVEAVRRQAVL